MKRFQAPMIMAVASVLLFMRGCGAAKTGEIIRDKMGRASTGNQAMLLSGLFLAISVVWAAWLVSRDGRGE